MSLSLANILVIQKLLYFWYEHPALEHQYLRHLNIRIIRQLPNQLFYLLNEDLKDFSPNLLSKNFGNTCLCYHSHNQNLALLYNTLSPSAQLYFIQNQLEYL